MGKKKKKKAKKKKVVQKKQAGISRVLLILGILLLALAVIYLVDPFNWRDQGTEDSLGDESAGEIDESDIELEPGAEEPAANGQERVGEALNPIAYIEMESGAVIEVELDPTSAPNTVANFIYLAGQGFYDGLIFHRVIDGFMIQGGCPDGAGLGGPGHQIRGEFGANNFDNPIAHNRGVISMARAPVFDSAGSQFFITVEDTLSLDGQYAAFGWVISGMEEADRISLAERDPQTDKPLVDERIVTITVDTFGVNYGPPEKL